MKQKGKEVFERIIISNPNILSPLNKTNKQTIQQLSAYKVRNSGAKRTRIKALSSKYWDEVLAKNLRKPEGIFSPCSGWTHAQGQRLCLVVGTAACWSPGAGSQLLTMGYCYRRSQRAAGTAQVTGLLAAPWKTYTAPSSHPAPATADTRSGNQELGILCLSLPFKRKVKYQWLHLF